MTPELATTIRAVWGVHDDLEALLTARARGEGWEGMTMTATRHDESCGDTRREGVGPLCVIGCPERDREERPRSTWTRVARITEDDTTTYRLRCEDGASCYWHDERDVYTDLGLAARDARRHTTTSGHATIVEALR